MIMDDRDIFAAAALAGLLARNHAVGERDHCHASYAWADAMLRQQESNTQLSSSSSSEPIGRKAERQSPDRECEESRCRDVPQADNARAAGGPAANTPSEIVERLRTWTHSVNAAPVSDLMDEAADEIERLRSAYATAIHCLADNAERLRLTDATPQQDATPCDGSVRGERMFTLTNSEREAVLAMACHCDTRCGSEWVKLSATLRSLLERLK